MCGIAGIVGARDRKLSRSRLDRMLRLMARRGPDDEGVAQWESAILGHRRLSIFDLSAAGHQPMLSDDGSVGIVFNGAIYNFRDLRTQLEVKGHRFHSRTDTEVLLTGYLEWGIDNLLDKIDGMFSFALWNRRKETLYLVRDRLGVKPLSFCQRDGELCFASTVRAVKSAVDADLSSAAIAEFLEFGFITDDLSIYSGIEKVRAGEVIQWRNGSLSRRIYWEPPAVGPDHSTLSFQDAVDETESFLLSAVEKRLQSDVPVGALLSGGVDSSLVCWAISKLGADLTAFTVATPDDPEDESRVAAETSDRLHLRHQVLDISSDVPPNIRELTEAFAEPFACASALGMLRIAAEAKRSVTVLLTGDGGDDIFLGYPEHRHFQLSARIANRLPAISTGLWRSARNAVPAVGGIKRAVSLLDYSVGGLGAVGNARDGLPFYRSNQILGKRLEDISLPHRTMDWSIMSGRNLLSEFLTYDRKTRFTGEYLPKVDGATMHHGLEARSPFLDAGIWEFASILPFSVRLRNGASKAILREVARRRIGSAVALGKKKGFTIPVQRWITGTWREHVAETLKGSILAQEGWINTDAALRVLKDSKPGSWAPRQLWFLYVLESWMRYEKEQSI